MILKFLMPKLESHFSGQFSISGSVITFPGKYAAVGSVEVHDDVDELTVYAGNFSHLHFSSYDTSLSREQVAERISDDALRPLIENHEE